MGQQTVLWLPCDFLKPQSQPDSQQGLKSSQRIGKEDRRPPFPQGQATSKSLCSLLKHRPWKRSRADASKATQDESFTPSNVGDRVGIVGAPHLFLGMALRPSPAFSKQIYPSLPQGYLLQPTQPSSSGYVTLPKGSLLSPASYILCQRMGQGWLPPLSLSTALKTSNHLSLASSPSERFAP